MSDTFGIKITGANQSSAAFQQVVRDATQMGTAIDQAGQKAGRSLADVSAKSALVGAAIASSTMVLGEWSRAAAEDAAGQSRLQQSIENTGKSYDEYSEKVEKAIKAGQDKAFSDDATREALIKLNAVTNDSQASLDQLGLAMDFARARGISLASSAEIIAKVYGGNLGILSRYGIVLEEGATATEALAKIQQISAGQAQTYADSQLGWLDKQKDKWDELQETIGASTGELQQFLLLLPGLSAGATAVAGLVGGVGGLGTIARFAGPAALAAGGVGLAYGYSQDTLGTTQINQMANQFFLTMSGVLNELLPGNPYDQTKYTDQMAANQSWDAINALLQAPGMSQDAVVNRLTGVLGVPWTYDEDGNPLVAPSQGGSRSGQWIPPTTDEILAAASKGAAAAGIPIGDYIYKMLAADLNFIRDPVSGAFVTSRELGGYIAARDGRTATGNGATTSLVGQYSTSMRDPYGGMGIYNPFYRDLAFGGLQSGGDQIVEPQYAAYASGGSGAIANSLSGIGNAPIVLSDANQAKADAANLESQTAALKEQMGAWAGLAGGITSAADAQESFQLINMTVMDQQSVYSGQQSEYQSQLNALTAGYDILTQRKADGIALTAEEQALLDNYPGYYERLTGGVEDATVANALLAAQYTETMKVNDEMNQGIQGTTRLLEEMILQMDGVPDSVKTEILLENSDESIEDLIRYQSWLNSIPGYVQTVVDTVFVESGDGSGGRYRTARLGGVLGYANGGMVRAELAEAGPELLHFRDGGSAWAMNRGVYAVPQGTYVDTAPASKAKMKAAPGGGITITGPVYIYPATGDVQREFTNALVGDWRQ